MSVHMEYHAVLLKGDGATTYESTEFLAADNLEAIFGCPIVVSGG